MRRYTDISLRGRNSFGIDARAAALIEFASADDLRALYAAGFFGAGDGEAGAKNGSARVEAASGPRLADRSAQPAVVGEWRVLGGGNNILFTRDYPGTLLHPVGSGIRITHEAGDAVDVRAEAGADWDGFVEWCVERGLWGAENLSYIPGTVGAAPVQNIGAYGAEAGDIITSVEIFSVADGGLRTLSAHECGFGYRESVFKGALRGKAIITAVNFHLSREARPSLNYGDLRSEVERLVGGTVGERLRSTGRRPGREECSLNQPEPTDLSAQPVEVAEGPTLRNIRDAVIAIRRRKLPDPAETGNAGSFFKNPVPRVDIYEKLRRAHPGMPSHPSLRGLKIPAAWLIELCGWKGYRGERVGVHSRQPLVLVNLGGATGAEVIELARTIQQDVREKTGVRLAIEVNIL